MSNKTLENLERDNSINKSKIESLQTTDGIMNEQLKILTKNVFGVNDKVEGSISKSLTTLKIGTKPNTTVHEHRYFGWVPTTSESVYTHSWHTQTRVVGFQIFTGTIGSPNDSLVETGAGDGNVSTNQSEEQFNIHSINFNLAPAHQYFHFSGDNQNELYKLQWEGLVNNVPHPYYLYWENTNKPVFYVHSHTNIQAGTPLFVKTVYENEQYATRKGYIVSAAAPDGPWVIRGSWDTPGQSWGNSSQRYQQPVQLSTTYDKKIFNEDDTVWSVLESLARLI